MRLQLCFITASFAGTKADGMESCLRLFCHKQKSFTIAVVRHGSDGIIIIAWLENNPSKAKGGEVRTQDDEFPMIKSLDTWVAEYCSFCVLKGRTRRFGPVRINGSCVIVSGNTL
jgi:hypothetical protein